LRLAEVKPLKRLVKLKEWLFRNEPLFDAVISLWDEHVQQRLKLAAAELEQSDYLGSLSLAGGV
jgi:hypothetical protein